MNKILAVVVSTLLMTSAAFGQNPEKIVVSSFYSVDKVSGWDGLVAAFNEEYPGVEVEVQVTPLDQYLAKLLTQIAGGDAPDIVAVENRMFPQFLRRNILKDLSGFLESTEAFALDDFFPNLLDRYSEDGKVFGIPYDAQPDALMFYNPSMFEAAGIAEPTGEWTWDDLRSAASALTVNSGSGSPEQYGLCLSGSDVSNWTYFLYTGGGGYVDDVKSPTQSTLSTQASIDATKFYNDLMHVDQSVPTLQFLEAMGGAGSGCASLFLNGKSAMMISGFWKAVSNPEKFKELGVKVVVGPTKDTGDRVYPTGGTAYSILSSSKNQELAWKFITEFLGQTGYETAYADATLGAIFPPANLPSYEWYSNLPLEYINSLAPNAEALKYVRFSPFLQNWAEISSKCIESPLDGLLRGDEDVADVLGSMAACVDAEL